MNGDRRKEGKQGEVIIIVNSLSADPADWPLHVTDLMRTELVRRGPYYVPPDFLFPFCVFIIEQVY